ncbi:MAG: hypothetical protein IJT77_01760 [Clostridia bacterium]|nr:hypothetical protein [Clostridia bacterium]
MMLIKNHASDQSDIIEKMIVAAIDAYHDIYESPLHDLEIIVCQDAAELNRRTMQHTGKPDDRGNYDGVFLAPHNQQESFRILLLAKDEAIVGAKRYFSEVEKGSRRDDDLPDEERTKRGLELAAFCQFVEMLQHEYSHLCSYEKYMQVTNWKDPLITMHSQDYHLYDEVIARYRGTYAMLSMMKPYLELNLIYSIWLHYFDNLFGSVQKMTTVLGEFLDKRRNEIETYMLGYMRMAGKSGKQAVKEMEDELGHPLEYRDEWISKGKPKLSKVEAAEYMLCDDFDDPKMNEDVYRTVAPLLYFARNPYATYEGAQFEGFVHAYYDYLCRETGQKTVKRNLELHSAMDKPFYLQVDLMKTREDVNQFNELFKKLLMI